MNFEEYIDENIEHVAKIREKLKARFGAIDRDLELLLVKAAVEPWGLVKGGQQIEEVTKGRGNMHYGSNGDQKSYGRQLSEKQKKILEQHLKGELGPQVAARINKTKKPIDQLSVQEASEIIDFIFKGVKQ